MSNDADPHKANGGSPDRPPVTPLPAPAKVILGIGEAYVAKEHCLVWTVLGSCVSVVFYVPSMKVSTICHAQLPTPTGLARPCDVECPHPCRRAKPEFNQHRFVSCSIEYMLDALYLMNAPKSAITAYIVGGASVIASTEAKHSVGQQNIDTDRQLLSQRGIPVSYEDLGGLHGRTLTYATGTGAIVVRLHGTPPK